MEITPYTNDISQYLCEDEVINYSEELIANVAKTLLGESNDRIDYIKNAYEYVRDNISHSADIGEDAVTCSALEVLREGHGVCFAKSHLLASLLRSQSIPVGFCYQKLILDDETAPYLVLHGLNGVFIEEYQKWVRLDARGNRPGVNAQFSIEEEKIAFPAREEKVEEDILIVFPRPDENVIKALRENEKRSELWDKIPQKLAFQI